jgi:hypothetical protein
MEVFCASEMSVDIQRTTRRYMQDVNKWTESSTQTLRHNSRKKRLSDKQLVPLHVSTHLQHAALNEAVPEAEGCSGEHICY